jgi:hypothetical protein
MNQSLAALAGHPSFADAQRVAGEAIGVAEEMVERRRRDGRSTAITQHALERCFAGRWRGGWSNAGVQARGFPGVSSARRAALRYVPFALTRPEGIPRWHVSG